MKKLILLLFVWIQFNSVTADEGFWSPIFTNKFYGKIKQMGLELSPENIYNNVGTSLSNAVVNFNGNSTATIISNRGLLITNYHCCSSEILSNIPYYSNAVSFSGFWAENQSHEIHIPNLYIKRLVEIKYISKQLILSQKGCKYSIEENIEQLRKQINKGNQYCECVIKSTTDEDIYIIYVYEIFKDVRLVAVPPSFLGRFGGEKFNWEWPRYSADFSFFRIYSNKYNMPSVYSNNNVPYVPKSFIQISTNGYSDGDFNFLIGYPGNVSQFESSDYIKLMTKKSYPLRAKLYSAKINNLKKIGVTKDKKQEVLLNGLQNKEEMWSHLVRAMDNVNVYKLRRDWELDLFRHIQQDSLRFRFGEIRKLLFNKYSQIEVYSNVYDFYREGFKFITVFTLISQINRLQNSNIDLKYFLSSPKMDNKLKLFYDSYDNKLDEELFVCVMNLYEEYISSKLQISSFIENKNNIKQWGRVLYRNSVFSSYKNLKCATTQDILNDPLFLLMNEIESFYNKKVWPYLLPISKEIDSLKKERVKILHKVLADNIWLESDGNMRFSYGFIKKGFIGNFNYQTKIKDLLLLVNKNKSFKNLRFLFKNCDINLPLCFLTNTQTSSGSSGSPVLNSKGELIGVNFDRSKEGTMGDLYFDGSSFRNIVVDIRYVIFVVKQYKKSNWLLKEINLK